jgi:hypothetical protein
MNCPASLLIILKKQWSMQMDGIGKPAAWSDFEIYVGGRKIESTISSVKLILDSEESNILKNYEIPTCTGTILLSKKSLRQFRKIYMIRKVRLPRKLKKKIKKTIW